VPNRVGQRCGPSGRFCSLRPLTRSHWFARTVDGGVVRSTRPRRSPRPCVRLRLDAPLLNARDEDGGVIGLQLGLRARPSSTDHGHPRNNPQSNMVGRRFGRPRARTRRQPSGFYGRDGKPVPQRAYFFSRRRSGGLQEYHSPSASALSSASFLTASAVACSSVFSLAINVDSLFKWFCASIFPCSAAFRYHSEACKMSLVTPSPNSKRRPRFFWAGAKP
jgi:hypothetical protein